MTESEQDRSVRISVRNLVEFILREGDIDSRLSGSMEKDAMQMGGRLHRKIQKSMGAEYHAEVPLKKEAVCGDITIRLEGRADGIIIHEKEEKPEVIIDEIKGVLRDLEHIEAPVGVHLAQAKCYAYIYAEQKGLEKIGIQMTYCNLDTEDIKRFHLEFEFEDLRRWFDGLIRQYEKWARYRIEWRQIRNGSIRKTEFPFPYREGQKDLAASV